MALFPQMRFPYLWTAFDEDNGAIVAGINNVLDHPDEVRVTIRAVLKSRRSCCRWSAGGSALIVDAVDAQAPEGVPRVEPQREAAPKPAPKQRPTTAHNVIRAAKPTKERPEPAVVREPAVKRPAEDKRAKPDPRKQWEEQYREMTGELARRYRQGNPGG